MDRPDFRDDILAYLQARRGRLVTMMAMVGDLTYRVKARSDSRRIRGQILSDLTRLLRDGQVVRYRKVAMVRRKPRSAQGFLRIKEIAA